MWELMLQYFEDLTLSLYKTELYPLACQVGASVLIYEASEKIYPMKDWSICADEELEPGIELQYFCDSIHDFFSITGLCQFSEELSTSTFIPMNITRSELWNHLVN